MVGCGRAVIAGVLAWTVLLGSHPGVAGIARAQATETSTSALLKSRGVPGVVGAKSGALTVDAERLEFLQERLQAPQLHARIWYWGWLAAFAGSIIYQAVRMALVDRSALDANAQLADYGVSAAKSALALGNRLLFFRLPERAGAAPIGDQSLGVTARIKRGEAALARYAKSAARRMSWIRHALGLAVNLAGFFVIWRGYSDLRRALINSGFGLVAGQAIIWTQPWQSVSDLEEYESQYGAAAR